MATVDNQQGWLPYDGSINRDCSQGFCSIYCPQWCYVLFSPPPPLSLAGADNDSSSTTFSPLVISIIAILASALLLVSYYTFVSKNCASLSFSRRPFHNEEDSGGGAAASVRHEEWHVLPSNGLDEALINKITVLRYKREEGLVDGTDCSVCLGEFKEEESLRLLPKCSHAFHLQCIDTWLKSHANCPLCRANIVLELDGHEEEMVMIVEDAERSGEEEEEEEAEEEEQEEQEEEAEEDEEEEGTDHGTDAAEIGEEDSERVRRCLSMGSSAEYPSRVSIADVLQMSMEEEYMVAKNCGLVGDGGAWRRREREQNSGNGRSRGLNCVMSTVRMKRSVSSGRFFFSRQGRGRSSLLPV
ncbi:hypothetical protein KFK09_019008 [Dendrobium nobile]|uniref:RING-type E3 ubiquitin transferase n=1 Tax=Dendrobium nobile TaxID=94219 RepID=A0A8T3AXG3_DENNO|nr:hypothetical protein KFK09_019008 [Dendrobium nobile]